MEVSRALEEPVGLYRSLCGEARGQATAVFVLTFSDTYFAVGWQTRITQVSAKSVSYHKSAVALET